MINNNQILNPFLSDEFVHIEDIIVLDEPILSHYVRNEIDYFLYLVDKETNFDKYLLFHINSWTICEYFIGNMSLLEVINSVDDFIYILDINFDGELLEKDIANPKTINKNYLPNIDSKIFFKPLENSLYYKIIEEHKNKQYINELKKSAFYMKISPKTSKYGHTVGLKEMAETLFKKVSESYSAFTKADFTNKFERIYTELKEFKNKLSIVNNEIDFRLVDAGINSFEIGLAVDRQMKMTIEDKKLREWALKVGDDFKATILDVNYSDDRQVELILEKFSPEQRKKIFTPMFEIIENKNFEFQIKNNKRSKYKTIKIRDKFTLEKIVPIENKAIEVKNNDLEIVQVTTLVEKGKNLKTLKIDQNTLFSSTDNTNIILKYDDFVNHGYEKVDSNIQIKVNILTNNGLVFFQTIFDNLPFEVNTNNSKLDDGISLIISKLYEYILNKE